MKDDINLFSDDFENKIRTIKSEEDMIPIIGFFVSKSVKKEKISAPSNHLYKSEPSTHIHYYSNQEKYSDLKPKVRKEEEIPCDRILHIDDDTEKGTPKTLSRKNKF